MVTHFELKELSAHGAVFRSGRAYETGTSFACGIHLPAARRHRLMGLEAIVVDCRPAGRNWELTLLFESLTPRQMTALRAIAQLRHAAGAKHRPGLN
jgi:PilZ domain